MEIDVINIADIDNEADEVLTELESLFLESGYTQEQIEEIKHADGAENIWEYIDNLESEQGYWDC